MSAPLNPSSVTSDNKEPDVYSLSFTEPFLIDVPKHFFDKNGEFTASPPYSSDDILYCMWTGGQGISSGWIDLNYQERGGNGGGSTTEDVGCAKWS